MRCKTLLIWLRFGRFKANPWKNLALNLALTTYDYFNSSGFKQEQAKVNFLATLWQLDLPKAIELMNDLLW
jgi:hypothetical protein